MANKWHLVKVYFDYSTRKSSYSHSPFANRQGLTLGKKLSSLPILQAKDGKGYEKVSALVSINNSFLHVQ